MLVCKGFRHRCSSTKATNIRWRISSVIASSRKTKTCRKHPIFWTNGLTKNNWYEYYKYLRMICFLFLHQIIKCWHFERGHFFVVTVVDRHFYNSKRHEKVNNCSVVMRTHDWNMWRYSPVSIVSSFRANKNHLKMYPSSVYCDAPVLLLLTIRIDSVSVYIQFHYQEGKFYSKRFSNQINFTANKRVRSLPLISMVISCILISLFF